MILQVFSILIAASLLSLVSCTNNKKSDNLRITLNLPDFKKWTDKKIGREMPPHHEPDAVHPSGHPGMPDGNFPQLPPGGPGVFDFPGGQPGIPGGNFPRLPGNPGMPGGNFPGLPGNPGMPGWNFPGLPGNPGMPGWNFPGLPGNPGMPGGNFPRLPGHPGIYDFHPLQPGKHLPGVFPVAGSENVPFPGIFFPGKGPSVPNPGPPNGFRPGGFFPEAPVVPNQPGPNSDGSFPRRENNGGAGGSEMYDDPAIDSFPFIEPIFLQF